MVKKDNCLDGGIEKSAGSESWKPGTVSKEPPDDLNVALEAAQRAAAITLEGWNKPLSIKRKGAVDLVTEFDYRAELEALKIIRENFPRDAIVAEESAGEVSGGQDGAGNDAECATGKRVWHVDPLDGTNNFAHGFPMFASSVALVVDGAPRVGVIVAPVFDWTFAAGSGGGATFNGKRMQVSETEDLGDCLAVTGFPYTRRKDAEMMGNRVKIFLRETLGIRRIGAAALDLCFTACGWFDFFFENSLNSWDVAAGALIVEEAGGRVTDWEGNSVNSVVEKGEVAASNGVVHDPLLELLGIIRKMESVRVRQ